MTHYYDPNQRAPISLGDTRLNHVFVRQPARCATVNEYAQAAGIMPEDVLDLLTPYLENGTLSLEIYGDTLFVHTGPSGRPAPPEVADVAPNLWERLRDRVPLAKAYALWRLIRSLEASGWVVEVDVHKICFGVGYLSERPYFAVEAGGLLLPVLAYPTADELTGTNGELEVYERAGSRGLAITCDNNALDEIITAARSWVLTRGAPAGLVVVILEAPRFNPTILKPGDNSVSPLALSRYELDGVFE